MNKVLWPEMWAGKIYSGGWKEPGLGTLPVTEKATGATIGHVGIASSADVAAAAAAAHDAQVAWAEVPGPRRGDVLREFARLVLENSEQIAEQMIRETGAIRAKAQWEVETAAREILENAALGSQPSGILAATAEVGRHSIARRVPMGVVGVITPWNSPLLLAARAVAPALVTGNAVLLKPAPASPICGGVVFAQLLEKAGLPQGLMHVLPGDIETGEALVKDPLVDMVSFTGSTRAGRVIGSIAGSLLKRVSLELGGNNPYIVLDDVDIDAAVGAGAWGSFFHQGQICLTAGRHLVHERIAKAYIDAMVTKAKGITVGDPFTQDVQVGPIVNERQAANAERVVSESVAKGAQVLVGGSRDGLFFEPTVMIGVTPGMPAFDEEIFGPVVAITTFSDDDEAVSLANQTDYGLVGAVVSADQARAQRIADRLRVGVVHINDQTVLHEVFGPIGGVGTSGNGFNHSTLTNADQFTEWQWVTSRSEIPTYPF